MDTKRYRLSELLTIKNGKDYKHLNEGDIPVFGSGGYMLSVDSYLYDKVSILLPRKGTLSNIQYYDKGKFWTVDTCFYSKINEELVAPYYLYRYLKSLDLSGYDTGASIPSMTQKTYNSIKVEMPSLPIQQKIASILSTYDNLIENNTKRIKLLEQMAENLYKEWFVRFRFPGHENVEMENGLPKGWKRAKLSEIATYSTIKINSSIIDFYVSTENMLKDCAGVDTNMFIEAPEGNVTKVCVNDILVSNIRPYFKKIWLADKESGCSNDVLNIKANKGIDSSFLYYTIRKDGSGGRCPWMTIPSLAKYLHHTVHKERHV